MRLTSNETYFNKKLILCQPKSLSRVLVLHPLVDTLLEISPEVIQWVLRVPAEEALGLVGAALGMRKIGDAVELLVGAGEALHFERTTNRASSIFPGDHHRGGPAWRLGDAGLGKTVEHQVRYF